jgi:carbon storage regulator
MLILERRHDEQIMIGDDITLTIVGIRYGSIRLGVDAPKQVPVVRDELLGTEPYAKRRGGASV